MVVRMIHAMCRLKNKIEGRTSDTNPVYFKRGDVRFLTGRRINRSNDTERGVKEPRHNFLAYFRRSACIADFDSNGSLYKVILFAYTSPGNAIHANKTFSNRG